MEDIFTNIANFGFSVVISIYLLVRMESKIDELTKSINELNKSIIQMKWQLF